MYNYFSNRLVFFFKKINTHKKHMDKNCAQNKVSLRLLEKSPLYTTLYAKFEVTFLSCAQKILYI